MMTTISRYTPPPSTTNQQRTGVLSVNSYVQSNVPNTPLFRYITDTLESVMPGKALDILENARNSITHELGFYPYVDEGINRVSVIIQEIIPYPTGVDSYQLRFSGSLAAFADRLHDNNFREKFPSLFGNSPKPTPAPDAKTA
jgi:hypothetical protein